MTHNHPTRRVSYKSRHFLLSPFLRTLPSLETSNWLESSSSYFSSTSSPSSFFNFFTSLPSLSISSCSSFHFSCQTLSSLSPVPVIIRLPATIARPHTSVICPVTVLKQCWVESSQNLTVVSLLPVTTTPCLSSRNATEVIGPL